MCDSRRISGMSRQRGLARRRGARKRHEVYHNRSGLCGPTSLIFFGSSADIGKSRVCLRAKEQSARTMQGEDKDGRERHKQDVSTSAGGKVTIDSRVGESEASAEDPPQRTMGCRRGR